MLVMLTHVFESFCQISRNELHEMLVWRRTGKMGEGVFTGCAPVGVCSPMKKRCSNSLLLMVNWCTSCPNRLLEREL